MGKGSGRRPTLISREEEELRWALAYGGITRQEFDRKMKSINRKRKR